MKILYYDCFSGISGDMNLGALIDLGVPFNYICEELNKLGLNNEFKISAEKSVKKGITGTKVKVIDLNNQFIINEHHEEHSHYEHHSDNHHQHFKKTHHHGSRNYNQIKKLINNSTLNNNVKEITFKIFDEIAIAEGKIHNKPIDEVHFHEVGAIDSIVDIVAAAIALDYLKIDKIIASPIEVGYGMVHCAHGIMPIPAPATIEILKDIPIKSENVPFEATTPTGAAIIKATSSEFTYKKDFIVSKIGYGIGEKDNNLMANVLRVFLSEDSNKISNKKKEYVLECNIDDMRAEEYELLMERLFNKNALDVFYTNILMKKQRAAIKLSIICREKDKENLKRIVFLNSSTIGIREYEIDRTKLDRKIVNVNSKWGEVPIKISIYENKELRIKPEYDFCKEIAKKYNISINDVYNKILFNYKNDCEKN